MSKLFPYRCSEPTCTTEVGFAARRCPKHWTPELAQSNIHTPRGFAQKKRTLDDEIVGLLQRRPGLDLSQLAQLTEIKQGSVDNPLASPLNQTLKRMRDAGRIRTNNQWGAPRFFLCLESDLHVEKGRD